MTIDDSVLSSDKKFEIVLVDDEQPILELMRTYLESYDYAVTTYADSRAALRALNEHEPHLAIIDFKIPHLTGLELYKKAKEVHPHMQVLFGSGIMDMVDVADLSAQLGLTPRNFLAKPYRMNELLERARYFCEIAQAHLQELKK